MILFHHFFRNGIGFVHRNLRTCGVLGSHVCSRSAGQGDVGVDRRRKLARRVGLVLPLDTIREGPRGSLVAFKSTTKLCFVAEDCGRNCVYLR